MGKTFYLYNLFLIITGGVAMSSPQIENTWDKPVTTGSVYGISSSEIPAFELEAIRGNGEMALKLSQFYKYALNEISKAHEWEIIGAENGNVISQHNTANALLYNNNSDIRGIYWYRIAASNGNESSKGELDLLGVSYEFDIIADLIFESMPQDLTDKQIEQCKQGALKGNGKAALILAGYLKEKIKDKNEIEYWFRIGAQNGNLECQYNLGLILCAKPEQINQERGKFWLNCANQPTPPQAAGYGCSHKVFDSESIPLVPPQGAANWFRRTDPGAR
jgi:TPR repeat protein